MDFGLKKCSETHLSCYSRNACMFLPTCHHGEIIHALIKSLFLHVWTRTISLFKDVLAFGPFFPGSSVFYLSWNSLINIKKCCYFSHLKKKKNHSTPHPRPTITSFLLFSAKLVEGVACTYYLWFFSCFL